MADESPTPLALTRCETNVLRELATGATDGEIASRLFVSRRTVQWHMGNLREKFDVNTRTKVLLRAQSDGLI